MRHTIRFLDTTDSAEIERAFRVFTHLRPQLDFATFGQRIRAQHAEGYKVVYCEQDSEIVAAAGFRQATFLAWGRVFYIDDLITLPERKRLGYGGALLDWLIEEGRRQECDEVHLDTGHSRHDAHRLYLNKGFRITSHHMSLVLNGR